MDIMTLNSTQTISIFDNPYLRIAVDNIPVKLTETCYNKSLPKALNIIFCTMLESAKLEEFFKPALLKAILNLPIFIKTLSKLVDAYTQETSLHFLAKLKPFQGLPKVVYHNLFYHLVINNEPQFVNKKDRDGKTPLHVAAAWNNELMVDLLLSQPSISPNAQDSLHLNTPLHLAASLSTDYETPNGLLHNENIVLALMSHPKVNVNSLNEVGDTPFHRAVRVANIKAAQALMSLSSTEICHQNKFGNTPQHLILWADRDPRGNIIDESLWDAIAKNRTRCPDLNLENVKWQNPGSASFSNFHNESLKGEFGKAANRFAIS